MGEVPFRLADYSFADNSRDYVVRDWRLVDLSGLIGARSLGFRMESTDLDPVFGGYLTPAYFALDDLTIAPYDLMMDGSTALADDIVAASTGPAGVLVLAPVARCGLPDADLADVGFGLFIVAPDEPPRGAGLAPDGPCVHAAAWLP